MEKYERETDNRMPDYNEYVMTRREWFESVLLAAIVLFIVGYIFYHNLFLSAIVALGGLLYPKIRTKQIIEKGKKELLGQFKDMIYSISSSLYAGKSMNSAFEAALTDLELIYPDENTDILVELRYILKQLGMNETVEDMLQQFADRSHLEDIKSFTDVFVTCKRSGGNLMEVIRSTSSIIADKIEIKQEIETLISGKKFEFKFLMCMPVVLVLVLSSSAADYMAPLYTTILGRIVMTVVIGIFVLAYFVGQKVMRIEI